MGTDTPGPIRTSGGSPIYGSGLPGAIWQSFMNRYLEGSPEEELPDEPLIDGDTGEGVPAPAPEPPPTTAPVTVPPTTQAPRTTKSTQATTSSEATETEATETEATETVPPTEGGVPSVPGASSSSRTGGRPG
jgi:membrane peptidoglycan carboxypeptidase